VSRATFGFILFAVAISLGCIRLGFWQLSRLGERRARNVAIAERLAAPPTSLEEALRDTARARYRRVQLRGRFDYQHERFLTGRGRDGAPGVHLLTPLLRPGSETPVLIVRGWVYSPDGMHIDLGRWHEGDSVALEGFVDDVTSGRGPVTPRGLDRGVRRLDFDTLRASMPYSLMPKLVVQTSDSAERADRPARLHGPALDEGPHKGYAIQWFAFAAIGLIGVGAVLRRELGAARAR
jgi:surfeit locus 1 family protein